MPDARDRDAALAEVAEVLTGGGRVVVCAHVNPDGDAIGSALALTLALRSVGVDATPTLADDREGPATYAFLPGFDLFRPASSLDAPDVFVALDTPSLARLGAAQALAGASGRIVAIDHHPDNGRFCAPCVVDPEAAATASIVWRLIPLLGVDPSLEMATACYVGLMTDTGRFSYSNTSPSALHDAAAMIQAGADPSEAYRLVYESRTAASLALLGRTLSRITLANDGRVVYSWITDADLSETGALPEETENLVDAVRQTGGVEAVAFFKAGEDDVRVSLRAKTAAVDVSRVAHRFAGGGHRAASGATIAAPLDIAIARVLAALPGGSAEDA